jgi:phenylpropionate dioxygenase-like ring-hydroxylating dioxygenase large terminal subunit
MNDKRSIDELIRAQRPGYPLEQRFYVDPEIYTLEIEKVINRNWFLAGHTSEVSEPGDFKIFRAGDESAIIVRGSDGVVRAFANVCRHRGSLVCLEDKGHVEKFMCPYHGWMYDIDGNLTHARSMDRDFDMASYGLNKISHDVVHGLIFVCFSDNPPGLESAKRDLAAPMAMFDFDNLKVASHKVYDIPANWKLAIENYQECYHCATAHPEYSQRHTLQIDERRREHLQKVMLEKIEACGLRILEFDCVDTSAPPGEMGYGYSRTAMFDGYESGSRDGKGVAPLLGSITGYDGGASDFNLGGFSFLLAYSDHVVGYVFTPVDEGNCRCEIYWLVRADAVEGTDYDVDELTWLWDVTTESDKEIIVNNYRGVRSRYYRPGPFSWMEADERRWIEWVLQELRRP